MSGISILSELVSLLIKSEEQSFSQNQQANLLNAEAESLEDELKEATRVIDMLQNSQVKGEKTATRLILDLSGKVQELQMSLKEKNSRLSLVKGCLEDSFVPVAVRCR